MNHYEFEQFVMESGKDILRFCRMTTMDTETGNELYQDTMLKLLEKRNKIDNGNNVKSYAISVAIMLWKSKKKKYSVRKRIAPLSSLEEAIENGEQFEIEPNGASPEAIIINKQEAELVRQVVAKLPDKYRIPIHMSYSADMKMDEIADCLHIPLSTLKTRIRKAKQILKEELGVIGYDR